jgi:hypothetical protein
MVDIEMFACYKPLPGQCKKAVIDWPATKTRIRRTVQSCLKIAETPDKCAVKIKLKQNHQDFEIALDPNNGMVLVFDITQGQIIRVSPENDPLDCFSWLRAIKLAQKARERKDTKIILHRLTERRTCRKTSYHE